MKKVFNEFSRKKKSFRSQTFYLQSKPNVYLSHEVFHKSSTQSWAITPILIDILTQLIKPKTKWFVVCEANSMVNLKQLLMDLEQEDYRMVRNDTEKFIDF